MKCSRPGCPRDAAVFDRFGAGWCIFAATRLELARGSLLELLELRRLQLELDMPGAPSWCVWRPGPATTALAELERLLPPLPPWRPCCSSCGSELIDRETFCCCSCGARWQGSEVLPNGERS